MHGHIIEVILESVVAAHELHEVDLLKMGLLIDHEDNILIGYWNVMKACSNIIGERVNAGIRLDIRVPWIREVDLDQELPLKKESNVCWYLDVSLDHLS